MKRKLFWLFVGITGATALAIYLVNRGFDNLVILTDEDCRNW